MQGNPLETPVENSAPPPPAGDPVADTAAPPESAPPVQDPAPNAEASFLDFVGKDLTFKEGAFKHFPVPDGENAERYEALGDKFNDIPSLAKSYISLERMLSKDKMPVPTDSDGQEVWDRVYDTLGRPESGEYAAPEGIDPDGKKAADAVFHRAGLSQRQADVLYQEISSAIAGNQESSEDASAERIESAIQDLESSFGPRGGQEYKGALDKAKTVASHLGLDEASFWEMPGFAAKMASQYSTLIDSKVITGRLDAANTNTYQSIQEQITDIQTNPSNPLFTAYKDGDKAAHDKVLKLFEALEQLEMRDGNA